jgi:hypothetical protein
MLSPSSLRLAARDSTTICQSSSGLSISSISAPAMPCLTGSRGSIVLTRALVSTAFMQLFPCEAPRIGPWVPLHFVQEFAHQPLALHRGARETVLRF